MSLCLDMSLNIVPRTSERFLTRESLIFTKEHVRFLEILFLRQCFVIPDGVYKKKKQIARGLNQIWGTEHCFSIVISSTLCINKFHRSNEMSTASIKASNWDLLVIGGGARGRGKTIGDNLFSRPGQTFVREVSRNGRAPSGFTAVNIVSMSDSGANEAEIRFCPRNMRSARCSAGM